MKKKIIGLFICTLLVVSFFGNGKFVSAKSIKTENNDNTINIIDKYNPKDVNIDIKEQIYDINKISLSKYYLLERLGIIFPSISWILGGITANPCGGDVTFCATLWGKGLGAECCDLFFVWDDESHLTWPQYEHQTTKKNYCGTCPHYFCISDNGINRGTWYYARGVAINDNDYGKQTALQLSFCPGEPEVETNSASEVEYGSACLNGKLTDGGFCDGSTCDVWFVYDTTSHNNYEDYSYSTPHQTRSSTGSFNQLIDELELGTRYYYRAVASNDADTDDGDQKSFLTWGACYSWEDSDGFGSGTTINFDASCSDHNNSVISYKWDWTNDGCYDYTDTDPYCSHEYENINQYDCKLKITTDDDLTGTIVHTVEANVEIPTDDANIAQNSPDNNFGSSNLQVRNNSGSSSSDWELDTLVKFDLSPIPSGTTINNAILKLFYYNWDDNNPSGRVLNLSRITSSWTEDTVTWNTKPSLATEISSNVTVPASTGVWILWNVTDDVQKFVDEEETNWGWEIKDENGWGSLNIPTSMFYSKEYTPPDYERYNLYPYLKIETEGMPTNDPPNTPNQPSGPTSGYTGISYTYSTSTTDPNCDDVYYWFDWGDGNNSGWVGPYSSGETGSASKTWDDPGTYQIKTKAKDIYDAESDWSPLLEVIITKPQNYPPVFSNEIPPDNETEVSIDISEITVDINDPDGDYFDWSVQTSPFIGSNSGISESNGTKKCEVSGLNYDTTYTWYVTATDTDGSGQTSFINYTFTTESESPTNHPPILSTCEGWSDGVDPDFGLPGTEFTFKVHYSDEDGDNPAIKDLCIKNPSGKLDCYTMHGSGSDSCYEYSIKFNTIGTYKYYFFFTDGNGGSDTLPPGNPWEFQVIPNCAEKPTWQEEQKWQFELDEFNLNYGGISLSLEPFNLLLEVSEINGNQVKFVSEGDDLTGDIDISVSFLTVSGELNVDMNGLCNLILDNENLKLKKVQFSFVGIIDVPVGRDIIIDPLQITVTPENGEYNFLNFPLCEKDSWNIPKTTFDISIYLRYKRWVWKEKWIAVPPFSIGNHDVECIGVETVNGFKAFHVKSEGICDYWYSPVKENIVKADVYLPLIDVYMELLSSPPYKPATPTGKTNVKVGETCEYSTSTSDPNGDRIIYGWDWNGDKEVDEWKGLYKSGETCIISHTWKSEEIKNGRTQIFVKAMDARGEESVWSDPLVVTTSRNKVINSLLQRILNNFSEYISLMEIINFLGLIGGDKKN